MFPEALSGGIAENMTTLMGSSSALMFLNPSAYPVSESEHATEVQEIGNLLLAF